MAGYIGNKAVGLNVTTGDILGDVGVGGDVTVGDDLTVTDDAAIGGTLGVTGLLTALANITIDLAALSGNPRITFDHDNFAASNYIEVDRTSDAMEFQVNGAERFTIETNGDVTIEDGNLIVGTAGHGIDFAATSGPTNGSSASELFNDYEEGTWTPVANAANSTPTVGYSARGGTYIKIGNMVTIFWDFTISSISGASGAAQITGLPYSATHSSSTMAGHSAMGFRSYDSIPADADSLLNAYLVGTTIHHEYDAFGAAGFGTKGASGAFKTGRSTGYFTYATNTN